MTEKEITNIKEYCGAQSSYDCNYCFYSPSCDNLSFEMNIPNNWTIDYCKFINREIDLFPEHVENTEHLKNFETNFCTRCDFERTCNKSCVNTDQDGNYECQNFDNCKQQIKDGLVKGWVFDEKGNAEEIQDRRGAYSEFMKFDPYEKIGQSWELLNHLQRIDKWIEYFKLSTYTVEIIVDTNDRKLYNENKELISILKAEYIYG